MAAKKYTGMSWVRLYTDAPRHHKVLELMAMPKGREAWGVYCFALAWSGDQRTDGHIPDYALSALHATRKHTELLEQVGLWNRNGNGWHIHNWGQRQETTLALEEARRQKRRNACARYQKEGHPNHPAGCQCWNEEAT
jgi:hypothetical protein